MPAESATVPETARRIHGKHFRRRQLRDVTLTQILFSHCTFSQLTLAHFQGKTLYFENCSFSNVTLQGVSLARCLFRQCQLENIRVADFRFLHLSCLESSWRGLDLRQGLAERWLVTGGRLDEVSGDKVAIHYWTAQDVVFSRCRLRASKMQDATWYGSKLSGVIWQACSLIRQVMGSCQLERCRYTGNQCDTLVWSHCQLHKINFRQLKLENASFQQSQLYACNLKGCNLGAALFTHAALSRCDLSYAQLPWAQLTDAVVRDCHLVATRLTHSCLRRAHLSACHLLQTDFTRADLRCADVSDSPLGVARTANARFHGAQLHPRDRHLQTTEPLLMQIEKWYSQHQPGPQIRSHSPLPPTGVHHYV